MLRRVLCCALVVVLCWCRTSAVKTGTILNTFPSSSSATALLNAVIDNTTGNIYIGSVNWLYVLNSTLHVKKAIHVGPKMDSIECDPDPTEECNRTMKNSTILALAINKRNNVLIACSDRYYGYCFTISLDTFTVTDEFFKAIVSNKKPPVLLVGPGIRSKGVLYVGTTHGEGLPLYKDRVPMLAVRDLDGFNVAHVDASTSSSIDLEAMYRENFEVTFIHAFSHGQYSYFLVVRRENPDSETYKTKIIRLCHKDERFQSYIEMSIDCEGYNLLQDAYVGKPGKDLGKTLGMSATDDMIFGVFAESVDGSSNVPGANSAVCVYSMADIAEKFLNSIKLCFSGAAQIGPAHLTASVQCTRMNFPIEPTYCMEADHNFPIDSGVANPALAKYPVSRQLTSISVKVMSDSLHTLVVLGTAEGKIIQASIDDQTTMTTFSETDLGLREPVHRDMFFDLSDNHVYAMSRGKMSRVSIQPDCGSLQSCGECLSARNPHCGWCSMENSCSLRKDCSAANNEYGWLPYNHAEGCPTVLEQDPTIVQYDYADSVMITLKLNFLPHDLQLVPLKCAVVGYGKTRTSEAILDILENKIVCNPFQPLPNFPKGEAHLDMQLSVLVYSISWISTNITFYDCSHLNSCAECASTALPCDWCLEGSTCLPKTSKCMPESYTSARLRRQAPPTAVALSPSQVTTLLPPVIPGVRNSQLGTWVKDASLCPLIKADKTQFLTPAGYTARISVYATGLRDFQRTNLKCNFDIGTGLVVNASHTYDRIKDQLIIQCEPTRFVYNDNEPYVDVPFDVSWDVGKFVDNPNNIHVRAFKCSAMVSSCGLCSLLDPVYDCGWCGNQCLQKEECTGTWLPRDETCPNAQITDFTPKSGSVNGGTNLTVHGINLGKTFTDLTRVTVAGIPCKVTEHGYVASESFTCITNACNKGDFAGEIEVLIANTVKAKSPGKFTYVDPVLADFLPQRGPLSGGTHVVISGENLDLGSKIVVSIMGKDCPVVRRNFTHLEFLTAGQDNPVEGKVKVTVDGTEDNILGGQFSYVVDPTVLKVEPVTALISGGTNLTVFGRHLNSIQQPKLLIKINELTNIKTNCVRDSATELTCPLPSLLSYGLDPTSTRPTQLHYGFIMDGVLPLRNISFRPNFGPLQVYADPLLNPLQMPVSYSDGLKFFIQGQNLRVFDSVAGLAVTIGNEVCKLTKVEDRRIDCKPPSQVKADALDKDGNAEIKVHHGLYYSQVGSMSYTSKGVGVGIIILAVIGVIVLIGIIVLVVFLVRRERRRRKKKTMPPPPSEVRSTRYVEADRYKDQSLGLAPGSDGTHAEMMPLKTVDGEATFDDTDTGKPFRVEDVLERVKSTRLKDSLKEVLIPRERLDLGEIIGRGHFGCVYAAYLRDENLVNPEKVAVKTLQAYSLGDSFNQQSVELFLKEGVTMRNFNHLHVLKLLGVCFDEEAQPMVILPYMAKGDLRSYVKDKKKNFTARQLLQLGRQVAEGMSYLASLNFVHRDLAARNCMIDENDQVKVADFGLSRELYEKDYYSSKDLDRKGKMPIKWMALESLEDFVFTTKSDVWSFGVLIWELMMRGVTPYPDVDVFDVRNFLASGRRLRKPKYCPDNIYQIMLDCWNAQPILRPTFTDLVNRIELMLNPTAKSPKPIAGEEEPEQIYMNLSSTDTQGYLNPVDNADGTVSFRPAK